MIFSILMPSVGMAQTSVLGEGDVVDVTLQQRAMALGGAPTLATLNNGGAVATLPRHALKGQFLWRINMIEFLFFIMFEILDNEKEKVTKGHKI